MNTIVRFLRNVWGFLTGYQACWKCRNRFNIVEPMRCKGSGEYIDPATDKATSWHYDIECLCKDCFSKASVRDVQMYYTAHCHIKLGLDKLSRRLWLVVYRMSAIKRFQLIQSSSKCRGCAANIAMASSFMNFNNQANEYTCLTCGRTWRYANSEWTLARTIQP